MSNLSPLESDRNESDVIVDALLNEVATNENADDLAFLKTMEAAIEEADVVPMPAPAEKVHRKAMWSSGVAATLLLGAGLWFAGIQINTINEPVAAQIVAYPQSSDSHKKVIETTRLNQLSMTPPVVNGTNNSIDSIKSSAFSTFSVPNLNDPTVSNSSGSNIVSQSFFDHSPAFDGVTRRPLQPHTGSRSHISIPLHESITLSQYNTLIDNPWASPLAAPLSTFSTDVDTASWTNLRAMIRDGATLESIPNDAVRIEEIVNYFDWNYPQPQGEEPFSIQLEAAPCPWNESHQLLRVGLQGREIPRTDRPAANLVFLLDVSGSMNEPNKLPLLKQAISILVEELTAEDEVAIVVYAGSEGLALPPTSGREQKTILNALANLESGGSTNGGAGIKLAYRLAKERFVENGINRVILCTDGDFNVGLTGTKELVSLVEKEAESGTYLSVLGFGQGNLNDAMLEEVTNRGNGNYFHIDGIREARKVLLSDLMGTLVTIAKDVKIQVEFNPARVAQYRLIGYANRKLAPEDFANDEVDAGEIGSGHTVTALYEIIPGRAEPEAPALRYQNRGEAARKIKLIPSEELALIKLRYKKPEEERSILMTETILPPNMINSLTSRDHRFAAAVALFGMILRDNEDVKDATLDDVLALAKRSAGPDPHGYRTEFVELVKKLSGN
ncbi:VWA domain-containing protein [Verrucomicrobiales bacterium BCK34]|nr:VWA domain-containing protein [Verrucomicrobiales bacterium BCK34]